MSSILRWFESPVIVVTASHLNKTNGMTAAWITQVSFNPTLLGVAIAPERFTHELIESSGSFAINVLREGQENIAKTFGFRSGRTFSKFDEFEIFTAKTGAPILKDCGAYYDCNLVDKFTTGDHTLFIGEVIDEGLLKGKPFLPFRTESYF